MKINQNTMIQLILFDNHIPIKEKIDNTPKKNSRRPHSTIVFTTMQLHTHTFNPVMQSQMGLTVTLSFHQWRLAEGLSEGRFSLFGGLRAAPLPPLLSPGSSEPSIRSEAGISVAVTLAKAASY